MALHLWNIQFQSGNQRASVPRLDVKSVEFSFDVGVVGTRRVRDTVSRRRIRIAQVLNKPSDRLSARAASTADLNALQHDAAAALLGPAIQAR